jgi:hypothetical protein
MTAPYTGRMVCAICANRRPKRFCPGVHGDICTTCCGEGREVTVSCPLECEYLQEARKHEKGGVADPQQLPNRDIHVTEEFLASHEPLLVSMSETLIRTALNTEGVVDLDVRDALDALIRTYRTLDTGIQYETRPENRLAAVLYDALQEGVTAFRKRETEETGLSKTRDNDVLGLLVFFQHFELDRNNGRKRGRAFLDVMREFYPQVAGEPASPSPLIFP